MATSTTENRILSTSNFEKDTVNFLDQLKNDPEVNIISQIISIENLYTFVIAYSVIYINALHVQVGDVVWALRQVMIDIMCVKSRAKPPPRRYADIWDVVAVESKMYQVIL